MIKFEDLPKFVQALFAVLLMPIWIPVMLWAVICSIYSDKESKNDRKTSRN